MLTNVCNKNLIKYFFIFIAIIIADRITKAWALTLSHELNINKFLSFGLVFNRGINWGILNSPSSTQFIIINGMIALVIASMILYTIYCWRRHQLILGQTFIIAGALSNYFDRIYYGGVIDFIVLWFGNWSWPAFNIADMAIVIGVGIVALINYRE